MINLTLQSHVPVIIGITLVIAIFVFIAYGKLKKYNPLDDNVDDIVKKKKKK